MYNFQKFIDVMLHTLSFSSTGHFYIVRCSFMIPSTNWLLYSSTHHIIGVLKISLVGLWLQQGLLFTHQNLAKISEIYMTQTYFGTVSSSDRRAKTLNVGRHVLLGPSSKFQPILDTSNCKTSKCTCCQMVLNAESGVKNLKKGLQMYQ